MRVVCVYEFVYECAVANAFSTADFSNCDSPRVPTLFVISTPNWHAATFGSPHNDNRIPSIVSQACSVRSFVSHFVPVLPPYVFLPFRHNIIHFPVLPMTRSQSAVRSGNVSLVHMKMCVVTFLTIKLNFIAFSSQLREPFCQPFGNRRLLHCLPAPSPDLEHPDANSNPDNLSRPAAVTHPPGSYAVDPYSPHHHADGELLEGETVAWESCGRIVVQERADFWEFVACNLLFVCVALVLVILRSKRMTAMHARQLATRIGLARGYG